MAGEEIRQRVLSKKDEEIEELVQAVDPADWVVHRFAEVARETKDPQVKKQCIACLKELREDDPLSEDAEVLLIDVAEDPFTGVTERYERIGNKARGHDAKEELVQNRFVKEREIKVEPVRRKLLELTDKARDYLETINIDPEIKGRGGIVHQFWQHYINDLVSARGADAKIEHNDADVLLQHDGETWAVEVAMQNRKRELEHVMKHLRRTVNQVVVVARDRSVARRLQHRIRKGGLLSTGRVDVITCKDLMSLDADTLLPVDT